MDNAIDLHVHSTCSDGTLSVDELADLAEEIHLQALALTDHDCIDGNPRMAALCRGKNIDFIPGVELSTGYLHPSGKEIEIHVLGYYIQSTPEFSKYLQEYRYNRDHRNEEMIALLNQNGFSFTYQDFLSYFPKGVLTRAHIARYLYDHKMISSIPEAFDKYIGDGCCCYVNRRKVCAEEAITLIHAAGGMAFLAHPTLYHLNYKEIRELISFLGNTGLDGVEGIYSTYKNEEAATIQQYAKENNLLISGGSDFHGANKPYIHLGSGRGNLHVPYSIYEKIQYAHENMH